MSSMGSLNKPINTNNNNNNNKFGKDIPIRKMVINNVTQLPMDYCQTPGGTLFSTTPGGKS